MPVVTKTTTIYKIHCVICGKDKNTRDFYSLITPNPAYPDDVLPICKTCILQHIDTKQPGTFMPILKTLDIAWMPQMYRSIYDNCMIQHRPTAVLGRYIASTRLGQYRSYRFSMSVSAQQYFARAYPVDDPTTYAGYDTPPEEFYTHRMPAFRPSESPFLDFGATSVTAAAELPDLISTAQPENIAGIDTLQNAVRLNLETDPLISADDLTSPIRDQLPPSPPPAVLSATLGSRPTLGVEFTKEELIYLTTKWSSDFTIDQLARLERMYLSYLEDFDIRTATQKDYLRKLCVTSLRYDDALDGGDVDGAKRLSLIYSSLTKEAGFQPLQEKEEPKYLDCVGSLVTLCESKDFIPRWSDKESEDKLDLIMKDYKLFLKNLLNADDSIPERADLAMKELQEQDRIKNNKEVDKTESVEEGALQPSLADQIESKKYETKENVAEDELVANLNEDFDEQLGDADDV